MSTPRLLRSLHTMSLAKAVPGGLKNRECKRIALRKRPPVPSIPKNDVIQEMVSAMNNNRSLKATIGEGSELRLSIWHTGMQEALLMHVESTFDPIEKQGHIKAYEAGQELYMEQCNAARQAKAALAELTEPPARVQEITRSLPRKPRKPRLRLMHLTPNCKRISYWTSRRPRKPQRMPRARWKPLQKACSSSMQTYSW